MLISEVYGIIALPTRSPDHPNCAWIMYYISKKLSMQNRLPVILHSISTQK
ncbi:hypothetical protein [Sutcliffiella horikoshii]|uniref:hypothetical protein n=1 Tax=Sutcliffiella horikoshii TaxID=79883 RepID=UPI003D816C5C